MVNPRLYIILSLCLASLGLGAQNATDALRFSTFDVTGTGRFIGTGSSLSALGTEFSVLSTNPAGLGLYRSSEIVFTPSVQIATTKSKLEGAFFPDAPNTLLDDFDNATRSQTESAFTISNLGFVVHSRPRSRIFTTMNFGIGINNLANFNQSFRYDGFSVGSIVERWQEFANRYGVDPELRQFEETLALETGALIYEEQEDFYFTDYDATLDPDFVGAPLRRQQVADIGGSMSELVFALGTNILERVMLGITVGVPIINYRVDREYIEEDPNGDVPFFEDLAFEETIRTTGQGINLKLGMLVRATQALRFGFAVHTPTSISFNDESTFGIGYTYSENGQVNNSFAESDRNVFDYRLSTPWRFFGNAGVLFGKSGFLTAEVEFVNYTDNNFDFGNFTADEEFVNEEIEATLSSVVNVRVGGEFVYKVLRARAGVGLMPSPFEGSSTMDPTFSGGLGVRVGSFFADLAYRYRQQNAGFVPYGTEFAPQQLVDNTANFQTFFLTLGFRY